MDVILAKSILKTIPTLIVESQLDESEDCDGRDPSVSNSDGGDGVTYPTPTCVVVIVGRFSFRDERL